MSEPMPYIYARVTGQPPPLADRYRAVEVTEIQFDATSINDAFDGGIVVDGILDQDEAQYVLIIRMW